MASSSAEKEKEVLGILCGGGPAPGMNGVISSVTLDAFKKGWKVIGIYDGFQHLMEGDTSQTITFDVNDVSRIHLKGGSILRTSRSNPAKKPETMENCLKALQELKVKYLVTIGGDDTATSAFKLSEFASGKKYDLRSVHVPKTIDNDLPLPEGVPTFGFQTAREVGVHIVRNLMEDSKTAPRWFLVVAMGRNAGHLALGVGKAAGAHLTVIPEEWRGKKVTFQTLCDVLECSLIKRLALGKNHGIAVLAEGLMEAMSQEELEQMIGTDKVRRDEHDHLMLDYIEFGSYIRDEMEKRTKEKALGLKFTVKKLGYEVRCADPVAFDIEYTRDLGASAVDFLANGGNGALVIGNGQAVPFDELKDPKTNKVRVRMVDVDSLSYKVGRKYMTRLEKEDFEDEELLDKMAKIAGITPEEFKQRYGDVVKY